MQDEKPELEKQIICEPEESAPKKQKVIGLLGKVRKWLNKEFRRQEPIPKEFQEFSDSFEREQMRDQWNRFM